MYTPPQILVRPEGEVMWNQYYSPPCVGIQIGFAKCIYDHDIDMVVRGFSRGYIYECTYPDRFEVKCWGAHRSSGEYMRTEYRHPNRFVDCTKCMHYDEDDIPF